MIGLPGNMIETPKSCKDGLFGEWQTFPGPGMILSMRTRGQKSSLLILAMTALACSRAMFALFDDPEGPNLLVVIGMAAVIYLLSSAVYLSKRLSRRLQGFKRSSAAIFIQIFVAAAFYLGLR